MAAFKLSGLILSVAALGFEGLGLSVAVGVVVLESPRIRERSSVFLAEDFLADDFVNAFSRGRGGNRDTFEGSLCPFGDGRRERLMRFVGRSSSLSSLSEL